MGEQSGKKHPRGAPTGSTPKQPGKRSVSRTSGIVLKGKKKLSFSEHEGSS